MRSHMLAVLLAGCGLESLDRDPAGGGLDSAVSEVTLGDLVVSPGELDFGQVELGDEALLDLVLRNSGDEVITLEDPLLTGDYGFDLAVVTSFPADLEAGAEQILSLRFAPVELTTYSGELLVRISSESGTADIALLGEGIEEGAGDDGGGEDDGGDDGSTAGDLGASPTSVSFGTVDIGTTVKKDVVLTNDSDSDILLTDVISPHATITFAGEVAPPQVLSAGASKTLELRYSPTAEVATSGDVRITTDSADTPELTVAVSGEGFQGCTICAPVISVDTGGSDSHTVALTDLGCKASTTIVVQNEGDEDLKLTDMDYANDSFATCGNFTASWAGPTTLTPWATTTVDVSYQATEFCIELGWASFDQNMLHIYSNDPSEPDYAIELTASVTCLY